MYDRALALDYGEKRVGIALSDALGLTAQPKPFLKNDDDLIENINVIVKENNVATIVVGLPLDTSGAHSKKSLEVLAFVEKLKTQVSVEIKTIDERFSTYAATKQLDSAGINRKKQKTLIDSQAAAFFAKVFRSTRVDKFLLI